MVDTLTREELLSEREELLVRHEQLAKQLELLQQELHLKNEENQYLRHKLFGRSKETHQVADGQLSLFDGVPPIEESPDLPDEEDLVVPKKRKKQKGQKRKVLEQFEEVPVVHELEDKTCPCCQDEMVEIGKTKVREEVVYQPAHYEKQVHYGTSYKCLTCSEEEPQDVIVKAPVPKAPIQNSLGSASVIAQTIQQKYVLKVPAYRQEKVWKEGGLPINRQQINRWHILCAQYYFGYLWEELAKELLSQDIIHADETSYRVIESDKTNTYYWLFQSGRHEAHPVAIYLHDESRAHRVPQEFLADFKGHLHSDMYSAYLNLPDEITVVGCFAHLRRKFYESLPSNAPPDSVAAQAVAYCDQAFALEKSWRDLPAEERFQLRQEELSVVLTNLFDLIEPYSYQATTGKLSKAIAYATKYKEYFMNVLKDGRLELSNNLAERSIKELVIGRKNWLFSSSLQGAQASGIILSLKVTADLNGLSPVAYFQLLLEELPTLYAEGTLLDRLQAYLPWSDYVKEKLGKKES